MKARSTMLVMVVFAIAGISPAAAQTVYIERYETYPAAVAPGLAYVPPGPKQFGLPFGTMARLGHSEPCSDAAADPFGSSKLNRTAPSGKVSLLASTDTNIRLANLSFGRSGRAH